MNYAELTPLEFELVVAALGATQSAPVFHMRASAYSWLWSRGKYLSYTLVQLFVFSVHVFKCSSSTPFLVRQLDYRDKGSRHYKNGSHTVNDHLAPPDTSSLNTPVASFILILFSLISIHFIFIHVIFSHFVNRNS